MVPLAMAEAGETASILKISGKDEVRQHLAGALRRCAIWRHE